MCGFTERYLSLIETGKKTPSPDVLARLAWELGVPVLRGHRPFPGPAVLLSSWRHRRAGRHSDRQ
ncbi:helix-turn-helix domain-containing protein [Streptomyces sp. NBC_00557]|uniref:helix-turn-helix domain-containing protein n=1 Tax=Streptomyces sp. NBC_00557 TaxID=2975776 RepID=UPI002E80835A|nr:helix-turn-helix transcriptional regulator [Streptomyces sp. NBC_00557]